jgi:hypothetical protein
MRSARGAHTAVRGSATAVRRASPAVQQTAGRRRLGRSRRSDYCQRCAKLVALANEELADQAPCGSDYRRRPLRSSSARWRENFTQQRRRTPSVHRARRSSSHGHGAGSHRKARTAPAERRLVMGALGAPEGESGGGRGFRTRSIEGLGRRTLPNSGPLEARPPPRRSRSEQRTWAMRSASGLRSTPWDRQPDHQGLAQDTSRRRGRESNSRTTPGPVSPPITARASLGCHPRGIGMNNRASRSSTGAPSLPADRLGERRDASSGPGSPAERYRGPPRCVSGAARTAPVLGGGAHVALPPARSPRPGPYSRPVSWANVSTGGEV